IKLASKAKYWLVLNSICVSLLVVASLPADGPAGWWVLRVLFAEAEGADSQRYVGRDFLLQYRLELAGKLFALGFLPDPPELERRDITAGEHRQTQGEVGRLQAFKRHGGEQQGAGQHVQAFGFDLIHGAARGGEVTYGAVALAGG